MTELMQTVTLYNKHHEVGRIRTCKLFIISRWHVRSRGLLGKYVGTKDIERQKKLSKDLWEGMDREGRLGGRRLNALLRY